MKTNPFSQQSSTPLIYVLCSNWHSKKNCHWCSVFLSALFVGYVCDLWGDLGLPHNQIPLLRLANIARIIEVAIRIIQISNKGVRVCVQDCTALCQKGYEGCTYMYSHLPACLQLYDSLPLWFLGSFVLIAARMQQLRFWSPYFHWAVPYYQSSSVFTAFWSLGKNKNRPFCRFPLVGIHREWRKNAYSLTDRWMDTNHPVHSAQKKAFIWAYKGFISICQILVLLAYTVEKSEVQRNYS